MSKKRIPCLHCGESILPEAKKCRFCGERLDGNEKRRLSISRLYFLWLSSLAAFFITLFAVRRTPDNFSNTALIAFSAIVVFGGITYLAMMVDILKEIRSKNAKKFGLISLVTFILFFWLLINIDTVEARLGFSPMPQKAPAPNTTQSSPRPSVSPTPTVKKIPSNSGNTSSVQTNKIDCIGPDGKEFSTTMEECKNLNEKWGKRVEYILDCNIHPDCGGGTVRMSKSQCESPCSGRPTTNKVEASNPTEQTSKTSVYCYNNVTGISYYTTSGEKCNLDNLVSLCKNGVKITYDYCMDNCLRDQNNRSSNCIYNYKDSAMTACLDESDGAYQQCMNACGGVYQDNSAKCY